VFLTLNPFKAKHVCSCHLCVTYEFIAIIYNVMLSFTYRDVVNYLHKCLRTDFVHLVLCIWLNLKDECERVTSGIE